MARREDVRDMVNSVLFIVILIIVSGFIAYWGDLLGRKMGKRRLTLFGLRPRYTAIVVTTITGMLIAALTLGVILTLNEYLRTMLMRGNEIRNENRLLVAKNTALKGDFDRLRSQQRDLKEQAAAARNEARQAEDKRKAAEQEVKKSSEKLNTVETQLDQRSKQLVRTNANLTQANQDYIKIRTEARRLLNVGWGNYTRVIQGAIIVQTGEEIARAVISPTSMAKRDFNSLLNSASRVMYNRGATVDSGKKGNGRAIKIVAKELVAIDPKGQKRSRLIKEDDSIRDIVKTISASKTDVVVVVRAMQNSVKGEQVLVDIWMYPNKTAFRKGEKIASTAIDGSASQSRVLNALVGFLQNDVRNAALRAGMIPVVDPNDPQAMFGAIEGAQLDEFMGTVDRIIERNATVRVQVVAQQDITVGERLSMGNLDFVVTQ